MMSWCSIRRCISNHMLLIKCIALWIYFLIYFNVNNFFLEGFSSTIYSVILSSIMFTVMVGLIAVMIMGKYQSSKNQITFLENFQFTIESLIYFIIAVEASNSICNVYIFLNSSLSDTVNEEYFIVTYSIFIIIRIVGVFMLRIFDEINKVRTESVVTRRLIYIVKWTSNFFHSVGKYMSLWYLIIVIDLAFASLALSFPSDLQQPIISLYAFISSVFYLGMSTRETNEIDVTINNLDFNELRKARIFISNDIKIRANSDMHIMKIDLSSLLEKGAKIIEFDILNQKVINFKQTNDNDADSTHNRDIKFSFYYLILGGLINRHTVETLNIEYEYEISGMKYRQNAIVRIEFIHRLNRFYVKTIRILKKIKRTTIIEKNQELFISKLEYLRLMKKVLPNVMQTNDYNEKSIKDYETNPNTIQQKFLLHNEGYGTGKTTINLKFAQDNNKIPIIISPFEDNSNYDFLYSLLINIKGIVGGKVSRVAKRSKFYYLLFLTCIFTIYGHISKDLLTPLGLDDKPVALILLYVVIFIVSNKVYKRAAIFWIPMSSNFITYNKKILIEQIVQDVISNNLLIVVEDLDRVSSREAESVLRDLASIANELNLNYSKNRIIGIISLEVNKIKMKSGVFDIALLEEGGKIISEEVFKSYNYRESIRIYYNNHISFLTSLVERDNVTFIKYEEQDALIDFRKTKLAIDDQYDLLIKTLEKPEDETVNFEEVIKK